MLESSVYRKKLVYADSLYDIWYDCIFFLSLISFFLFFFFSFLFFFLFFSSFIYYLVEFY